MREKIQRFMYGRNGVDDLAKFESLLIWIPLVLSLFIRVGIVQLLLLVVMIGLMVHMYFRVFSRNTSKRYEENQKFLNLRYDWTVKFNKKKRKINQMKAYRFYKCPMCKQEVRVPKGHGRIEITCPKCREQFVRKS